MILLLACGAPDAPVPDADAAAREAGDEVATETTSTNAAVGTPAPEAELFGAAFSLTGSEPLQTLMDEPGKHMGHDIRVVGEIANVCQAKGCWMVLRAEGGETMRITMKDHAFAVPKDSSGRMAHVQGELIEKAVDQKTVDHYKSEGANDEVPEEGKDRVYELVAATVWLEPVTDAG